MKFIKFSLILLVLLIPALCKSYSQNNSNNILSPGVLASNFLKLYPDSIIYPDQNNSRKWNYEQGLMMEAFYQLCHQSNDNEYINYIKKNLDYYIEDNGKIKTYKLNDYNLDNISSGRALLNLYEITKNEKYKKAADTLREQLRLQPRTIEGGFWHKKIYPNQMWLDGLFMAEPFYAEYTSLYGEKDSFNDIANQFLLVEKHCRDKKTGLFYHGWDESKLQKWANPVTGASPTFWGRAMGWYLMALVDVLDYFPETHPQRKELLRIFRELSSSLLKYRDPESKLWYQVINKSNEKGNYIETSASSMIIYAFAKGSNKKYLSHKYYILAEQSFISLQNNYITHNDGLLYLTNVCAGAGLGGVPYRDGTYNYYINESKRINDFKGYGPLLLSSIELENGKRIKFNKRVGLDYFYNNEYKNNKRYHYTWEDTANSGFSELGKIIKKLGASIDTLSVHPTSNNLKSFNIYIIVDPDTPHETEKPNFIDSDAVRSISSWVNKGGILVLFANDSANCDFTHLNQLSEVFGIHFNGDSENKVIGNNFDMGKFDQIPRNSIFKNVKKIYLKEISTIRISKNAIPVLKKNNKIIMASSKYGKGFVFAVGDPWLYNEYIDNRKLPADFENYKAAENLFGWLLSKTIN